MKESSPVVALLLFLLLLILAMVGASNLSQCQISTGQPGGTGTQSVAADAIALQITGVAGVDEDNRSDECRTTINRRTRL